MNKTTISLIVEVSPFTNYDTGSPEIGVWSHRKYYENARAQRSKDPLTKAYEVFFEVEDPRIPVSPPEVIGTHQVTVKPL